MSAIIKTYNSDQAGELIGHIQAFYRKYDDGKLDVQRHQENRSGRQQAKLHALIREIALHVGLEEDYFKQDVLKRNSEGVFASWPMIQVKTRGGDLIMRPKSESKLKKDEEAHVIDMLYVLGSEWGMSWVEGI